MLGSVLELTSFLTCLPHGFIVAQAHLPRRSISCLGYPGRQLGDDGAHDPGIARNASTFRQTSAGKTSWKPLRRTCGALVRHQAAASGAWPASSSTAARPLTA